MIAGHVFLKVAAGHLAVEEVDDAADLHWHLDPESRRREEPVSNKADKEAEVMTWEDYLSFTKVSACASRPSTNKQQNMDLEPFRPTRYCTSRPTVVLGPRQRGAYRPSKLQQQGL
jgi:hypothetical protein